LVSGAVTEKSQISRIRRKLKNEPFRSAACGSRRRMEPAAEGIN